MNLQRSDVENPRRVGELRGFSIRPAFGGVRTIAGVAPAYVLTPRLERGDPLDMVLLGWASDFRGLVISRSGREKGGGTESSVSLSALTPGASKESPQP